MHAAGAADAAAQAAADAAAQAAADVDALLNAAAQGARGTREGEPAEGVQLVRGAPSFKSVPNNHYLVTSPRIHERAFVAPSADLIGACVVEEDANIWFNCTLRADDEPIVIGRGSNVQDGCVLHMDPGNPLLIGKDVTIGHGALLHGCVIEDGAMVAIGATVLTGARIGAGSIIGAGAVVMEGTQIPPLSICFGVPAKVVRQREDDGPAGPAPLYVERGRRFREGYLTNRGFVPENSGSDRDRDG